MLRGADLIFGGGKRGGIPSGWVELDYIESTGTQYIDTGIIGYSDTRVKCKCALTYATNVYPAMWGSRVGSRNNDFQIYYSTGSVGGVPSSIVLRTGSGQKEVSNSDVGVSTSLLGLPLEIDARSGVFMVNKYSFTTPLFNFTTPKTIRMFCEWSNGANVNFGSFKYWHWSAYKGENELIHLVGVRHATTNEVAMCDILTGEIYRNQGTGAFIAGPDKGLPYLREVKCLVSHGTEWMLLDKYVSGMSVDIWLEDAYLYSIYGSIGAWNNGSRADTIRYYTNGGRGWQICNYNGSITTNDLVKGFSHFVIENGKAIFRDVEYSFSGFSGFATGRFALFGCYNYNASYMSVTPRECKIGRTRIYNSEGDVYDLLPVLDPGGRPALYDRVAKEFLYNQGSGEFTWEELD